MNRMESIGLAMKNESNEMKWYFDQAEKSSNPVVKKLFLTLAGDEKEHITRIKALRDRLEKDGKWPQDVPIEVNGTNVKEVIDGIRGVKSSKADRNESDISALKRAAEFEDKGSRFYAELSENCTNLMEKNFFKFLSGIEREHMLSIKDSLFYLEDPEGWLEHTSKQGLDGA
ncbi:MAG: ferritin family protein [Deltaproteobacteria bacterium]|nr:ferritin family protein [Deltaproteobacteria bacterium]